MSRIDEIKARLGYVYKDGHGESSLDSTKYWARADLAYLLAEVERLQRRHDDANDLSEAARQILETKEISAWLPAGTRILNVTADAWEALEQRAETAERERDEAYASAEARRKQYVTENILRDNAERAVEELAGAHRTRCAQIAAMEKERDAALAMVEARPEICVEDARSAIDVFDTLDVTHVISEWAPIVDALRAHAKKGGPDAQ